MTNRKSDDKRIDGNATEVISSHYLKLLDISSQIWLC
jgi:hypothetical protein